MTVTLTETTNKLTNIYIYIKAVAPVHTLKAYGVHLLFRLFLYRHWIDVNGQLQGPTS
jgi:hypothetical protein